MSGDRVICDCPPGAKLTITSVDPMCVRVDYGWISVAERLPEESYKNYPVVIEANSDAAVFWKRVVSSAHFGAKEFDKLSYGRVTHWFQLPCLPEVSK